MTERKYCEHCGFCRNAPAGISFARCAAPQAPEIDSNDRFVARELDKPPYASAMRGDAKLCGPDAKWFEARAEQVAA